jgi:hypothetical protein
MRQLTGLGADLRHQLQRSPFVVLEGCHPFLGPVFMPVNQVGCIDELSFRRNPGWPP